MCIAFLALFLPLFLWLFGNIKFLNVTICNLAHRMILKGSEKNIIDKLRTLGQSNKTLINNTDEALNKIRISMKSMLPTLSLYLFSSVPPSSPVGDTRRKSMHKI